MKPAIVLPFHDPEGLLFPHLQAILPVLKGHFACAYLCPSPATLQRLERLPQFRAEAFFTLFPLEAEVPVGDRFAYLYRRAAEAADPDQLLHLCSLDRLAFALRTSHRARFLADVDAIGKEDVPLIFQRSPKAWQTHPQNYQAIENFVTTTGRLLFGKDLDYAWCHLVLRASQLAEIMPSVRNHDLSMVAEMILLLQGHIQTRAVDWLAWEDAFILSRQPAELKRERENSLAETQRRLAYVKPMIETLLRYAEQGDGRPAASASLAS